MVSGFYVHVTLPENRRFEGDIDEKKTFFDKKVAKIPRVSAIFGFVRIDKNADALGMLVPKNENFEKKSQKSPEYL